MTQLPKAPQHEGVDPLTDGHRYHSEDVKGNSVHDTDTSGVEAARDKSQELVDDQRAADARADNAAQDAANE